MGAGIWKRWALALGGAVLAWAAMPERGAAQPTETATDADYETLFAAVLRNPANLDISFQFAEAATRRRDYEAAIGSLERIVFYNPNLPRVKLELGVLYFLLGSNEMARSYFEQVLAAPDVPFEVQARVQGFLAEIDRRANPQQFSIYVQLGYRYQTNANAGPQSQLVRAFGQDAVLGRQFVNRPDWNAFALGAVRYVHDFENQRGDVWETYLTGYVARQFTFSTLHIGLVEMQTGPRLAISPEYLPGWTVRPYGLVNGVTLGDQRYLATAGGGVSVTAPLLNGATLEPFVEGRNRRFENSSDYPIASQQTGRLWAAGAFLQGPLANVLGADIRYQLRAAYIRNDVRIRYDFNSYDQVAIDVGFPIDFEGPWGSRRWSFVPTAGYGHYTYDTPNGVVDPFRTRQDNEWRAGGIVDMPVYEFAGIAVQLQYSKIQSNIRNYDTRNLSVAFGPTLRF